MKISIDAGAKEIADLVLAIQSQRTENDIAAEYVAEKLAEKYESRRID